MNKQLTFSSLIENYFVKRLMQQQRVSRKTIEAYRDSFRLYFSFLQDEYNIKPSHIEMNHLEKSYVYAFCQYLTNVRGNKPTTVNARLSVIKSFLQFVSEEAPEYNNLIRATLAIPSQKQDVVHMDFVTKEEFNAIISCCDLTTKIGKRDKLMLLLFYNTGVRVSELLSIKISDIKEIENQHKASLIIHGKGRKERMVPLWKSTSSYLLNYINDNKLFSNNYLFINKNGNRLTRSGVRNRIDVLISLATKKSKTLIGKNISPHTFRHSVAMNLLSSGVDISTIAIWLGHSSIQTTHKYMVSDINLKRKAMEKSGEMGNEQYNYQPSDNILSFLNLL